MRYQIAMRITGLIALSAIITLNVNAATPTAKEADQFISRVNRELVKKGLYWQTADWVAANYITDDTQRLAAMANDDALAYTNRIIKEARRFDHVKGLSPDTARALQLIKLDNTVLSPDNDEQRTELARLMTKMESDYSSAKWCHKDAAGNRRCSSLQEISEIIDNSDFSHSPAELAAAWTGWHNAAKPMRTDYEKFVALANAGSRNLGFADTGELWRSGYDMSATQFSSDVERLWQQVKPLYTQLHCYVRNRLDQKYGHDAVGKNGLIRADLLGDMWAQDWSNLYPLLEPYSGLQGGNVTAKLKSMRDNDYQTMRNDFKGTPSVTDVANMEHDADKQIAVTMTHIAEDFYTSIGMPTLPDSFWQNSTLVKPRDRDMVCHASAWDFDLSRNDVRLKQCIEAKEDDLITVHHELGHVYYYLNYEKQPPLFQRGANDGFHEAIGDTMTLSLTPQHLVKIGLLDSALDDPRMLINAQMKKALDKIAFLPFGKLVDQWRWQVFSGQTKPDHYNAAWWKLREQYQGITAPTPRNESEFDPGAKYHIASNTPYVRYFLSYILQFQFQKALCDSAGHKGELAKCDIYGNKAAGEKFMAMLSAGASRPWQDTLEKLTGSRQIDAAAILEYFQPLMNFLREQNKDQKCGW